MDEIAIITVNYNGKADTLEFLGTLNKLRTENCELKTIVVDNASLDGSVSEIRKQFPKVDIIQTGQNLGFAGGYNRGLNYAKIWGADYFLIINNDTVIKDNDLIGELIKTFKSDPEIGLVSPKIYFAPGFEFHKDRYKKEELGKVIWYAGGEFDWDNIGSKHRGIDEVDANQYDEVAETELISGACILIKREVLEKVGLFDEKYFLYFEDSDFIERVKDAGFRTFYNGKVAIYHKVSQSTGIGSIITDYYHTRNRLIFGMKYAGTRTKFALLREALKFFLIGRQAQRLGVLDFYLGLSGGKAELMSPITDVEYPLKLSIGIVNYNTADLTKKLLESIFKKDSGFDPENMEVVVLDNGQIDPCKDKIKEFLPVRDASRSDAGGPRVKYLSNDENEGFSKGYNKTIRFSLGEYYLMLNSDIEVLKGAISELAEVEDSLDGSAVLGGKLVFPDMSRQDSVFHLPTITGAFKEYFLKRKGSYFMYMPKAEKPIRVEGLVMACFMIPQKILIRAGLLDEGTFIFFEDIEYCRRLKNLRIPLYFVPQAKFIHHHGGSTKRIGKEKSYEHLKKASGHYHGKIYNYFLGWILRIGQKFGRVKTPETKWNES